MTDKPPVPDSPFADWPRIPIDTSDGSPVARLLRTAGHAASRWTLGPDGPYRRTMTGIEAHEGHLREGLLHLLELGLLDIDTERLDAAKGLPCQRSTNPPTTAPQPCPPGCVACATDESHDPGAGV